MLNENPLRKKLSARRPVLGTWCTLGSPLAVESAAHAGLDFAIVDMEHGPFELDRVHSYVDRCESLGASPLVRVPKAESWMALQALDQGAHGVVFPHIGSRREAEAAVSACRYHPRGKRGFTPFTKAGGFSNERGAEYARLVNASVITVALVESREGLDALDEILAAEGLDVIYFGAYDLSQALGVPGQTGHARVIKAIKSAAQKTLKAGKCPGAFVAQNRDDIKRQLDLGLRFLTFEVDGSALRRAYAQAAEWFKEESGR